MQGHHAYASQRRVLCHLDPDPTQSDDEDPHFDQLEHSLKPIGSDLAGVLVLSTQTPIIATNVACVQTMKAASARRSSTEDMETWRTTKKRRRERGSFKGAKALRQQQPKFAKNLQGHNFCAIMN